MLLTNKITWINQFTRFWQVCVVKTKQKHYNIFPKVFLRCIIVSHCTFCKVWLNNNIKMYKSLDIIHHYYHNDKTDTRIHLVPTKICLIFRTAGSGKWCFAHEASSATASDWPCTPASCFITPHLLAAFLRRQTCSPEPERKISMIRRCRTTTHGEAGSAAMAPKPRAWPLLPLATFCHVLRCPSANRWLDEGWQRGTAGCNPWPLYERLTKQQKPTPLAVGKGGTAWEADKKTSRLYWTHVKLVIQTVRLQQDV